MAEFNTFDLGRVIQTAEAIKGMKRQSSMDALQERYLGQRIEASEQELARNQRSEQIVLGKEKAQQVVAKTGQILQAPNPKNFVEQYEPELIKALEAQGVDWATANDDMVKQMVTGMQNKANQELGQAPVTTQQVGGFDTLQQGGKVIASSKPTATKAPQSYDEYALSQKDPEFAKFLAARKGKGLSVTLPDGTVVEMGGEGGKVGPSELSKPTINNLQETIVTSTNRLDRLNATMSTYNPDFLRAAGIVDANKTRIKDFLGMKVSPDQRERLQKYTEFQSSAAQDLAATLKEMSGAAVTPQEYARTEKSLASGTELSPAQFEAKARTTMKTITRAIMRANWALKNGIGVTSIEELAKQMPLEGIDGVYESRANEIWQEMGGTPETKAQAIQQANGEFGLAR